MPEAGVFFHLDAGDLFQSMPPGMAHALGMVANSTPWRRQARELRDETRALGDITVVPGDALLGAMPELGDWIMDWSTLGMLDAWASGSAGELRPRLAHAANPAELDRRLDPASLHLAVVDSPAAKPPQLRATAGPAVTLALFLASLDETHGGELELEFPGRPATSLLVRPRWGHAAMWRADRMPHRLRPLRFHGTQSVVLVLALDMDGAP